MNYLSLENNRLSIRVTNVSRKNTLEKPDNEAASTDNNSLSSHKGNEKSLEKGGPFNFLKSAHYKDSFREIYGQTYIERSNLLIDLCMHDPEGTAESEKESKFFIQNFGVFKAKPNDKAKLKYSDFQFSFFLHEDRNQKFLSVLPQLLIPFESIKFVKKDCTSAADIKKIVNDGLESFGWLFFDQNFNTELEFNDFLREINPSKKLFVYFHKSYEYSLENGAQNSFDFHQTDKFFLILTEFPLTDIIKEMLRELSSESKKLLTSSLQKITQVTSETKSVFEEFKNEELHLIKIFSEKMSSIEAPRNFSASFPLHFPYKKQEIVVASVKSAFLSVLPISALNFPIEFALEEILLILFSIVLEKKVFFVSQSQEKISSSISIFLQIIRPFEYNFPVFHSVPFTLLEALKAPLPFIAGLTLPSHYVRESLEKKAGIDSLFVFLDEKRLGFFEEFAKGIPVPQFDDFLSKAAKVYSELSGKVSKNLKIVGVNQALFFQKGDSIKNKLVSLWKSARAVEPEGFVSVEKVSKLFFFFRFFFLNFVISRIGTDILLKNDNSVEILNCDDRMADKVFLNRFCATQLFSAYLLRHHSTVVPVNSSVLI